MNDNRPEKGMNDSKMNSFKDKISGCMDRIQDQREVEKARLNDDMKRLQNVRDKFMVISHKVMKDIVDPRGSVLLRELGHADVSKKKVTDISWRCEIPHTEKTPASTEIVITSSPSEDFNSFTLRIEILILPIFFEYTRHQEKEFRLDPYPVEKIADWVEEVFVQFIEIYSRVETVPAYYRDQEVVDPVCGMRILKPKAAAIIEIHGQRKYFCSDVCRDAFVRSNDTTSFRDVSHEE